MKFLPHKIGTIGTEIIGQLKEDGKENREVEGDQWVEEGGEGDMEACSIK